MSNGDRGLHLFNVPIIELDIVELIRITEVVYVTSINVASLSALSTRHLEFSLLILRVHHLEGISIKFCIPIALLHLSCILNSIIPNIF
jgi:hypothetical protein